MSRRKLRTRADGERVTFRTFAEPGLFLLPFLIGLLVFTVYPFINVILLSFRQDYSLMTGEFSGIGLGNYAEIFHDANFLNGLRNTALYVLFVVPIVTVLSLFLASLLNSCTKLQGLFQTCYFLPMVTSVTAVGLVWKWMFNYDYGLINYALSLFGVSPVNWLNDPHYNLAALIIYGIWSMLPFTIILLLSGFQNINPQYYTAARIDGASSGRIFRRITVPLLAPTLGLTMIVNVISASKVFSELFPLFNGNPGLGLLAVYRRILPVRHVLQAVAARPGCGQRRRAVRHRSDLHHAAALHPAQVEELLRYRHENCQKILCLSRSDPRCAHHGAAVLLDDHLLAENGRRGQHDSPDVLAEGARV